MKTTSCTEKQQYAFNTAPRCNAKTKRKGTPCCSPATRGNKRCRMHGGAKGSGGTPGNQNAWKHGHTTKEARSFRKKIKEELKEAQNFLDFFD